MSGAWKNAEKNVAKKIKGKRVLRGADFSKSAPDIIHPVFAVEVKYRKKISGFLKAGLKQAAKYDSSKTPILVLKEKYMDGELVVMSIDSFVAHMGDLRPKEKDYIVLKKETEETECL